MFCPNCGKPNLDDSRFCEECGSALVDNAIPESYQHSEFASDFETDKPTDIDLPKADFTKVKSVLKKYKFIFISALVVVVLLIAFVAVGSAVSSPKRIATNYFKAMIEGDYETMYSCLALEENELINKDTFCAYMQAYASENDNEFSDIKNFSVDEVYSQDQSDLYYDDLYYGDLYYDDLNPEETKSNSMLKTFNITVVDQMTGSIDYFDITLTKQNSKVLLFFYDYKVSSFKTKS